MSEITSIMGVTFNRLKLTKLTFDSLFKETKQPFRLIITDNGSEDGTPEYLKNLEITSPHCVSYHIILNKKNLGVATGRNQCLHIANQYQDPWYATIDNDILFPEDWLTKCLQLVRAIPKFCVGLNVENFNHPIKDHKGLKYMHLKAGNLGTCGTVSPREMYEKLGHFVKYGEFLYGEDDANMFCRARFIGYSLGYLVDQGVHLGVGEEDSGEYREYKNKAHAANLEPFRKDCYAYIQGRKPIYESFLFPNEDCEQIINKTF